MRFTAGQFGGRSLAESTHALCRGSWHLAPAAARGETKKRESPSGASRGVAQPFRRLRPSGKTRGRPVRFVTLANGGERTGTAPRGYVGQATGNLPNVPAILDGCSSLESAQLRKAGLDRGRWLGTAARGLDCVARAATTLLSGEHGAPQCRSGALQRAADIRELERLTTFSSSRCLACRTQTVSRAALPQPRSAALPGREAHTRMPSTASTISWRRATLPRR